MRNGFVPDAILFDLMMPERDGYSFLQSLIAEHLAPSTSLIALTNQATDEDREKAAQLGATTYIVKATMTPAEVVAAVERSSHQEP